MPAGVTPTQDTVPAAALVVGIGMEIAKLTPTPKHVARGKTLSRDVIALRNNALRHVAAARLDLHTALDICPADDPNLPLIKQIIEALR